MGSWMGEWMGGWVNERKHEHAELLHMQVNHQV